MERYFSELATAFVRGRLGNPTASIDDGLAAGLRPPMAKAARGFPDSFSPNYRMTPGQIVEI